jgi:hypothetical protein
MAVHTFRAGIKARPDPDFRRPIGRGTWTFDPTRVTRIEDYLFRQF